MTGNAHPRPAAPYITDPSSRHMELRQRCMHTWTTGWLWRRRQHNCRLTRAEHEGGRWWHTCFCNVDHPACEPSIYQEGR